MIFECSVYRHIGDEQIHRRKIRAEQELVCMLAATYVQLMNTDPTMNRGPEVLKANFFFFNLVHQVVIMFNYLEPSTEYIFRPLRTVITEGLLQYIQVL